MAEEKLLTIRDVSLILGVSEKEVMDLAESGVIPAYKIGGVYLRFKRQEVEQYRKKAAPVAHRAVSAGKYPFKDRVSDFFYYNDFYILTALLILLILLVISRG